MLERAITPTVRAGERRQPVGWRQPQSVGTTFTRKAVSCAPGLWQNAAPMTPSDDSPARAATPPGRVERLDVGLRIRQAPNVLRRLRHPTWVLENLRLLRWKIQEPGRRIDLDRHRERVGDERTAVLAGLGASEEAYDAALLAAWVPPRDAGERRAAWDARAGLQSLVGITVRLLRPRVMLETGVARGFTTAVALAAMQDNQLGHLYSVDLPALEYDGREGIGDAVPDELKPRWTLEIGPSRLILPELAARIAPLDVFLHDSDHTYPSQMAEYSAAWPHLRSGGVLLSDDVHNEALLDFAAEVSAEPYLIGHVELNNAIGLLVKP